MSSAEQEAYGLTHQIRTLFNKMAGVIDTLHVEDDITSGQRAVLEVLESEPKTVPEMARERRVSRQHIQLLVNELLERELIETRVNPAHKRSSLIARTEVGTSTFDAMRCKEAIILQHISDVVSADELKVARKVLSEIHTVFDVLETSLVDDPGLQAGG